MVRIVNIKTSQNKLLQVVIAGFYVVIGGCTSNQQYRETADSSALWQVRKAQLQALNHKQSFWIETPADTLRRRLLAKQKLPFSGPASLGTDQLKQPEHWPEKDYPKRAPSTNTPVAPWTTKELKLSLMQALQVTARNSRVYQDRKEAVYIAALRLDDALDQFRNTYTGTLDALFSTDGSTDTSGAQSTAIAQWERRLASGASLSAKLIFDTARLLASDGSSSSGLFFDGSITLPLLRGSGRHIVYEPVTQAQRNLIYSLWTFEQFKRTIAVNTADEYLRVLQTQDTVINAQNNYDRRVESAKHTGALAEAGRLSKVQVDQARQAQLNSHESLIRADQNYKRQLDTLKISLGLPTDAKLVLDRKELQRLGETARNALDKSNKNKNNEQGTEKDTTPDASKDTSDDKPIEVKAANLVAHLQSLPGGPYEIDEDKAIQLALANRLDLKTAHSRVADAQRDVIIAADALKAGLDLVATGSFGSRRSIGTADLKNGLALRPANGFYSLGINADLPWERTREANLYRESYISLEHATRNVQALEDQIKLGIRNDLRTLLAARESYKTQALALQLAQQRVKRDQMFLDAGGRGVEIRDVLEAEDDLLAAQNALSAALVGYRVSELKIQRDMGVLAVNEKGLWREYEPQK